MKWGFVFLPRPAGAFGGNDEGRLRRGLEGRFEPGADALVVFGVSGVFGVQGVYGVEGRGAAQRSPPGTHSTSPVSLFAVRARMNSRSESRLR